MAVQANSAKVGAGKWKIKHYAKTASVAILSGTLVQLTAGYVAQATTTAGASDTPLLGIYLGPDIAATDATTDRIAIAVPAEPMATAEIVVGTGSLAVTDVGLSFDVDADAEVTVSTTANEAVTCVNFISATLGEFVLTNLSSPAA